MSKRRQSHTVRASRARDVANHALLAHGLTVAIIGAGRLGTALGLALSARGFIVTSFVATHRRNASRAARIVKPHTAQNEPPRALAATELQRIPQSSIYLFATPDDALPEASRALARVLREGIVAPQKPPARQSAIALHTSGALAASELAALREIGVAIGSLHPLVAIAADAVEGARNLQNAFCCIEGEPRAVSAARRIVRALEGRSFIINSEKKALYHAAAVITSGHTVALFDTACEMLTRCGLDELHARKALLPLLASTLRNLDAHAPAQALTGTFARADVATLRLHLDALNQEQLLFAAQVYRLLGRRATELAKANGADAESVKRIEELIGED